MSDDVRSEHWTGDESVRHEKKRRKDVNRGSKPGCQAHVAVAYAACMAALEQARGDVLVRIKKMVEKQNAKILAIVFGAGCLRLKTESRTLENTLHPKLDVGDHLLIALVLDTHSRTSGF